MIQEKDFLYRVPVKTAPITTPGGQIRNPEILVDVEGGEFMHGNILDANSTNKLINRSVKDAVDNKLNEDGYLTKDLLEAETSARTKGDEDLSSKIKAEQTRAEGKEKEILYKLTNEVSRATDVENGLQAAISAKADRSDLLTLENKVTANAAALKGKQDKGDYATRDFVTAELSAKQNKIPINTIDTAGIETADVTKLRTIVTDLINALISSGLIKTPHVILD